MQQANQPPKFLQPLAQNDASKADIPVTSPDDTRASQSLGFPPRTGQPPEAGGVPPQLPDMNGVLNLASRGSWWNQLGGGYGYDGVFATDPLINGYPQGATLRAADGLGDWISTANDNAVNPDTVGTGWVPGYSYGATALTSQTGGTVTLTPAQARKRVLTVAGTLTSNLVLVVPNWRYDWTVHNNTGGAFSVTVRTAGGAGASVPQNGAPTPVLCDGTNCSLAAPNIGPATSGSQAIQFGQATGRLLGVQRFTSNATYTPSAGTRRIVVELQAAGGGGAGVGATSATQLSVGSGGGGGAYVKFLADTPSAPVAVTIGTGGTGGTPFAGSAGNPGGDSVFGALATVGGGLGGLSNSVNTTGAAPIIVQGGNASAVATIGGGAQVLQITEGERGGHGFAMGGTTANNVVGGYGGGTALGRNGRLNPSSPTPINVGVGGCGASAAASGPALSGASGSAGVCVVWEYA